MEVDIRGTGWPQRAGGRWVAYLVLWTLTVLCCLFASVHTVVASVGALLGCALAASLPLIFATLFEAAYGRRAKADVPVIFCPCLGSAVALIGAFVLLESSGLVVGELWRVDVDSVKTLCSRYAGVARDRLPRTVCIQQAFIKTDWEAGKLRCESNEGGRVECKAAFAAAPIFDGEALAAAGLPDEIWAWAVVRGRHVDANYRPDGQLCGYLAGPDQFDFYLGDFRLAVQRVIEKHALRLQHQVTEDAPTPADAAGPPTWSSGGEGSGRKGLQASLEDRPLLLAADPAEVTSQEQAWLLAAAILLCLCPCVGPVPLGCVFGYWCWARSDDQYSGRHLVSPDDLDSDF
mmetsp:Transcript_178446/g.571771  ORF Transcript_178446/g.571771 Transcript_178446/m.571771 type:complete len:347 (-) Transcript_178446:128-1168(-)|eukprot:CAMPEP_0203887464 /NCGR_PEP_ID=MMETSP0359-20131031/31157_1 /ASSEMBLY_ACC=CAM_ASM_000338 /TAXON_ID=268821 /ORGANISM="Scrippsiella Hangoei, Strain SHTV-5" /LENGTH=346 /DNA_ID=CAMNT_0050808477 /DNA_START=113 /DNA_END=1153 /DNA_ORIENTATION=+